MAELKEMLAFGSDSYDQEIPYDVSSGNQLLLFDLHSGFSGSELTIEFKNDKVVGESLRTD